MKKIFKIHPEPYKLDIALLIARLGVAAFMLTHGWPKVMMLFGDAPIQFPGVMGMSPEFSLILTIFAEVICSILILIGLGTRLAAIPLIVTMAVAVFIFHAADPFASQEMGLLYLLVYLTLLLLGSGRYSVDALLAKKMAVPVRS